MKKRAIVFVLLGCLFLAGCRNTSQNTNAEHSSAVQESVNEEDSALPGESQTQEETPDGGQQAQNKPYIETTGVGKNKKSTAQLFAMDTFMVLTAYGKNAEEAVTAGAAEIVRLENLFSTNIPASDIGRVNEAGGGEVSEETYTLLERSLEYYEETGGSYDITVYPLVYEWGFTTGKYQVPSDDRIRELLSLVGSDMMHLDPDSRSVSFDREGMMIDLGTVAKGYTAQRVIDLFKDYEIESAVISLGGNVQLLGAKPDGTDWRVGIMNPDKGDESITVGTLETADMAVTTAGGYERYFEDEASGIIYRHIFDPATGRPTESPLQSVTVICKDGTDADGYDTPLFVMGKEGAIAFWKEHSEEFDMVLVDEDLHVLVTEGIADHFSTEYPMEVITKN